MRTIGIDPGASGAIALLDFETGSVEFKPTPGPLIDTKMLYLWLNASGARVIGLEEVTTVRGASATSNFKFGMAVGQVQTLALASDISVDRIRPKDWQKQIGVVIPAKLKGAARSRRIKQEVARIAHELYPNAELFGPKGGLLDGRSDALMIAHVMACKYGAV